MSDPRNPERPCLVHIVHGTSHVLRVGWFSNNIITTLNMSHVSSAQSDFKAILSADESITLFQGLADTVALRLDYIDAQDVLKLHCHITHYLAHGG